MAPKVGKYSRDALLRIAARSLDEVLPGVGHGVGVTCDYLGVAVEGAPHDADVASPAKVAGCRV